jgi:hypothetical protein
MHLQRDIDARARNQCRCEKAVSIKCSVCVTITFSNQHAMRMRRIILPSVACSTLQNAFSCRQTTTKTADICSVFIRHYTNTWRRTVNVVISYQLTGRGSFPGKVHDFFSPHHCAQGGILDSFLRAKAARTRR